MTTLIWDKIGERTFQTGVSHGAIYVDDLVSVWNGLTSVEDTSNSEVKSFYLDGVNYLNRSIPEDFTGKIKAITYPDDLDRVAGVVSLSPGLTYYSQKSKKFNMTYRTKIGNDIDGIDYGYKIHLLYNLIAIPDGLVSETISSTVNADEFSWTILGTPESVLIPSGHRPTAHISISSVDTPPDVLSVIEDILYGTDSSEPRFPSVNEIASKFNEFGSLLIVDNGDGTWTAVDDTDIYITMLSDTSFRIDNADVDYLNPYTYQISDTNV